MTGQGPSREDAIDPGRAGANSAIDPGIDPGRTGRGAAATAPTPSLSANHEPVAGDRGPTFELPVFDESRAVAAEDLAYPNRRSS